MTAQQTIHDEARYAINPTRSQALFHARYKEAQARMRAAGLAAQRARYEAATPPVVEPSPKITMANEERIERRERDIAAAVQRMQEYRESVGVSYSPTAARILARICRATGFTKDEIRSSRRPRKLALARQAVIYWICRQTGMTLTAVGIFLGGKDHATIYHSKHAYPKKRAKMGRYLREVR